MCMVVVYLDNRLKRHEGLSEAQVASQSGIGRALIEFLEFWSLCFDWDTKGITISPPGIVDKLPYTRVSPNTVYRW